MYNDNRYSINKIQYEILKTNEMDNIIMSMYLYIRSMDHTQGNRELSY